MGLQEIRNSKMEILLIAAKTDFGGLIFQMLARSKSPGDILTRYVTRKLTNF